MESKLGLWTVSTDDLKKIVSTSYSFSEIFRKLKLVGTGCQHKTLKKRMIRDNIDFSHIPIGLGSNRGRRFPNSKKKPISEVLVEHSIYNRGSLKKRLIKEGLLKNICSICGDPPLWKEKPLVLVLDHINGTRDDNRIENLRLLCPNCNSQQDTFTGRNIKTVKKVYYCPECKEEVSQKARKCWKCYLKTRFVIKELPSINEFERLLNSMSLSEIGRKYGVCGSTIKALAIRIGIKIKTRIRRRLFAHPCLKCGKPTKNQKYCSRECGSIHQRKIERPSVEVLLNDIDKFGQRKTAKKYGVSRSVMIRQWLKNIHIPA